MEGGGGVIQKSANSRLAQCGVPLIETFRHWGVHVHAIGHHSLMLLCRWNDIFQICGPSNSLNDSPGKDPFICSFCLGTQG